MQALPKSAGACYHDRMFTTLILTALLVLCLLFGAVQAYNRLVSLRQRCINAFAQIDVQLRRRHNLVPRLVATVKGAMKHERETLEAVTMARNDAIAALRRLPPQLNSEETFSDLARSENALTALLRSLLLHVEEYPDLKAGQNTLDLMEELRSTENRIAFARQAYNDAVATYNSWRESFPALIVAGGLGFQQERFLDLRTTEPVDFEASLSAAPRN